MDNGGGGERQVKHVLGEKQFYSENLMIILFAWDRETWEIFGQV